MSQQFWIVTILPLFLNVLSQSVPSCPPGQIQYKKEDAHHLCCLPIVLPKYCGLNKRVQRCTEDGNPDICVECEEGEVSFSNSTSGVEEDRCYSQPQCPEEAILSESGQCVCDESRCYYGDDQYSCLPSKTKCQENTYHKNGACFPCPEGTHRPGVGCGPCVSSALVNTMSETIAHPNPTNSPTPLPTDMTTKRLLPDPTVIEEKEVIPEDDKSAEPVPIYQIILIVVVSLIFIVIFISASVSCFRRRRQTERNLPPPYSEFDTTGHDLPSQINQDTGQNNGGAAVRSNNQTAQPFQNSRYGRPVDGTIQSFQPSSSSIPDLPPTGFSSRSSASHDPDSEHSRAPDQTHPKVASYHESTVEQQGLLTKPASSVVPVGDDADIPLLQSAPSLDPDSI